MDTKEAVEFINSIEWIYYENGTEIEKKNEVVQLLQRGEKYEEMWNHLYCEYGEVFLNDYRNPEILLEEKMEELKQKYFPKTKERKEK